MLREMYYSAEFTFSCCSIIFTIILFISPLNGYPNYM